MRQAALALMLLAGGTARAADGWPPRWWWALPGGGQFALGRPAAGFAYAAATAGLLGWAAVAGHRRESGQLNAPLLWAQQAWVWSLYDSRRDVLLRLGRVERLDPAKVATLAAAPFRPSVVLSPWVLGFAAAGWGVNALTVRKHRPGWRAIGSAGYLGDRWEGRAGASAALAGYWIPISYGAGTSEEMLFRGMFQADLEERWGAVPGWLAASLAFGAAHVIHPSRASSWEDGGFAALAGLWLGWRWRADGYRLGPVIAAHTWFDIAAGITAFLRDPAGNPLGARIRFTF